VSAIGDTITYDSSKQSTNVQLFIRLLGTNKLVSQITSDLIRVPYGYTHSL